jgi:hypothetical protein
MQLKNRFRGFVPILLKKKTRKKIKKKIPDSENEAREGLGPSQGPDTLADRFSGTREVVRTPTNLFEVVSNGEDFVPKDIIARRIQKKGWKYRTGGRCHLSRAVL